MAPAAGPDLDRMKAQALDEAAPASAVEAKKETGPSASVARQSSPAAEIAAPAEPIEAEAERRSDAVAARREALSTSEAPRKAKEAAAKNSADAASSAGAAAPKAEPPKQELARPEASRSEPAASASSRGFVAEPPAPASAPPPPPPAPVMSPSPGAQRAAPFGAAADQTSDDRLEQAPADVLKDEKRSRDSTASESGRRSSNIAEEDGAAAGALSPRAAPAMPATKSLQREGEASDHFAPTSPEDWIRRIRELRDDGNTAAAKALLESFRSRYPDHALPEDLRELSRP